MSDIDQARRLTIATAILNARAKRNSGEEPERDPPEWAMGQALEEADAVIAAEGPMTAHERALAKLIAAFYRQEIGRLMHQAEHWAANGKPLAVHHRLHCAQAFFQIVARMEAYTQAGDHNPFASMRSAVERGPYGPVGTYPASPELHHGYYDPAAVVARLKELEQPVASHEPPSPEPQDPLMITGAAHGVGPTTAQVREEIARQRVLLAASGVDLWSDDGGEIMSAFTIPTPSHAPGIASAEVESLTREIARWEGLTAAIAEIEGYGPGWPDHGNAPLAIAAGYSLLKSDADRLSEQVKALGEERDRAQAVNERDRSLVATALLVIKQAMDGRRWLADPDGGRGSYAYSDEGFKHEFGQALGEIDTALEPLRLLARDWSDCPTSPAAIRAARALKEPFDGQA